MYEIPKDLLGYFGPRTGPQLVSELFLAAQLRVSQYNKAVTMVYDNPLVSGREIAKRNGQPEEPGDWDDWFTKAWFNGHRLVRLHATRRKSSG